MSESESIRRLTVCGNPIENYVIVRPKSNLSYLIGKEILRLQDVIYIKTGIKLPIITDNSNGNLLQINIAVIGDTQNIYEIKVGNSKVFINGENEVSCAAAVGRFISMIEKGEEIASESGIATETEDGYRLVWNDEFDGDSLDTKKWTVVDRVFKSKVPDKMTCFCDRPENLRVKNSNLEMIATFDGEMYYGCEIECKDSMWYKHGYVEISAKFPCQKGMVPAFWSRGWGKVIWPEIDFFEALGGHNEIKGTLLGWQGATPRADWPTFMLCTEKFPENATYYKLPEGESFYDEYHTIGFYWDETTAIWTCDGVEYARCDELCANEKFKETFSSIIHLLFSMQTAVNNYTFPPPDDTTDWEKATFSVDYVRLYQTKDQYLRIL